MLSNGDLSNIASMIDPNHETNSPVGGIQEEIDISHLDYGYVSGCSDKREILSLLTHLR